jgi:hypothetical protein
VALGQAGLWFVPRRACNTIIQLKSLIINHQFDSPKNTLLGKTTLGIECSNTKLQCEQLVLKPCKDFSKKGVIF